MLFFFFNDTATTEIYTLSLHDALPISYFGQDVQRIVDRLLAEQLPDGGWNCEAANGSTRSSFNTTICVLEGMLEHERARSEEHTSELQSRQYLVCRLLLEKKKHIYQYY